jgi:hypothetical protein
MSATGEGVRNGTDASNKRDVSISRDSCIVFAKINVEIRILIFTNQMQAEIINLLIKNRKNFRNTKSSKKTGRKV